MYGVLMNVSKTQHCRRCNCIISVSKERMTDDYPCMLDLYDHVTELPSNKSLNVNTQCINYPFLARYIFSRLKFHLYVTVYYLLKCVDSLLSLSNNPYLLWTSLNGEDEWTIFLKKKKKKLNQQPDKLVSNFPLQRPIALCITLSITNMASFV